MIDIAGFGAVRAVVKGFAGDSPLGVAAELPVMMPKAGFKVFRDGIGTQTGLDAGQHLLSRVWYSFSHHGQIIQFHPHLLIVYIAEVDVEEPFIVVSIHDEGDFSAACQRGSIDHYPKVIQFHADQILPFEIGKG